MATASSRKLHIPDELLEHIFSFLRPPLPEVLGHARYEHIDFAEEDAEVINQYTATRQDQFLPRLKTNDGEYKIGISTLSNCSRACTRFECIVRPLLYESYPGQPIARLQTFNRTLVRRPDLARMVKYIAIGCWEINILSGLERWWKSTVKKVGLGQELLPALLGKAEAGHEDAQAALLLSLCINVQAIDISVPLLDDMSVVNGLIKKAATEQADTLFCGPDADPLSEAPTTLPLHRLRSVSLREGDTSLTVGVGAFSAFLQLSTITSLTLYRSSYLGKREPLPPMPQMQELCLWRCELDANFCQSLTICKNLKTLQIIWPGMVIDDVGDVYVMNTTIDLKYIGDMISKSFPMLEKLVLDQREAYPLGESCTQRHILNLSLISNLKELAVGSQALWGRHVTKHSDIEDPFPHLQQILPPSIEKLTVLVDRRGGYQRARTETEIDSKRSQMLILNGVLRYLIDAPSCLRSVHLDMPYEEVQSGFNGLEKFFEDIGFVLSAAIADPDLQRASPVVGVSTPKVQRAKLRKEFGLWLPGASWSTVLINRSTDVKSEADLESWRAVMDDRVEQARH